MKVVNSSKQREDLSLQITAELLVRFYFSLQYFHYNTGYCLFHTSRYCTSTEAQNVCKH